VIGPEKPERQVPHFGFRPRESLGPRSSLRGKSSGPVACRRPVRPTCSTKGLRRLVICLFVGPPGRPGSTRIAPRFLEQRPVPRRSRPASAAIAPLITGDSFHREGEVPLGLLSSRPGWRFGDLIRFLRWPPPGSLWPRTSPYWPVGPRNPSLPRLAFGPIGVDCAPRKARVPLRPSSSRRTRRAQSPSTEPSRRIHSLARLLGASPRLRGRGRNRRPAGKRARESGAASDVCRRWFQVVRRPRRGARPPLCIVVRRPCQWATVA